MRIKISSSESTTYQASLYYLYFIGTIIMLGILVTFFIKKFEIMSLLCFGLIFVIIAFIVTKYLLKYLCEAYIDDQFIYFQQVNTIKKIKLNKIKSVDYFGPSFNPPFERWIIIKYFTDEENFEKKIFIPTGLNEKKKFIGNRFILGLINQKIKDFKKDEIP